MDTDGDGDGDGDGDNANNEAVDGDADDVCFFMGLLPLSAVNVATSNEKVVALQFHPSGKYFGYMRSNAKSIDIFSVRNEADTLTKKKKS